MDDDLNTIGLEVQDLTSSWRPLDFDLCALQALSPCDPRVTHADNLESVFSGSALLGTLSIFGQN